MEKMLKDKVAIITGAGRGIGQATAKLFAKEGAKVVVSDIDADPAEETVSQIKDEGGQAIAHVGDVCGPDFSQGIVDAAVKKWDGIHIIVNNAGFTWDAMIHKLTDAQWNAMMNIHITAPFKIIRAASPYFRDAAKKEMETGQPAARKIINISSLAGTNGNPGQANYSAGKAAVMGLTKTLAKEWGKFNVQVNAVAFGFIDTRLTQSKEKGDNLSWDGEEVSLGIPDALRGIAQMMIPMGRAGTPEEAAGGILFLASPLSNYVSGQTLMVGGGLNL